ncbi:hypothetical protein [Winogradskyella haliclonae]|uniref:Bacterial spore germination immunoglobulin-like domain-containing protein n=1 Tax=Winogradskyella haliclonae TaxID=2048558 RepID=A0ABQ2BV47_9FLAO|nr:hypothetical protein [Winogradskyella haliclonae]GGI56342.1 hypothetical protein GCM10011444_06510 [Winogradskyella haliclonae]
MKKLIILILLITFFSCDIGGEELQDFTVEIMPIESVEVPTEFIIGNTHVITVNYTRPNGCYEFNSFIPQTNGNTRTIAVVDTVYSNISCTQSSIEASVSFEFSVTSAETHIFQFFQGTSQAGEDQYLIVEVPVIQ